MNPKIAVLSFPYFVIVWWWNNIIWGRFDEVIPPGYDYAYLHVHTRAMQIQPYNIHIERYISGMSIDVRQFPLYSYLLFRVQLPSRHHGVCPTNAIVRPQLMLLTSGNLTVINGEELITQTLKPNPKEMSLLRMVKQLNIFWKDLKMREKVLTWRSSCII